MSIFDRFVRRHPSTERVGSGPTDLLTLDGVIPSPLDAVVPFSVAAAPDEAEIVIDASGRVVARVEPDPTWGQDLIRGHRAVYGAVVTDVLGQRHAAVVKKLDLPGAMTAPGGPEESVPLKWGREVAALDTSREVAIDRRSFVEEINDELQKRGLPNRMATLVMAWRVVRAHAPCDQVAIATVRLPGIPLLHLVRHHPEGLPLDWGGSITAQVHEILDACHHRALCLGDVSSMNFLVDMGPGDVPTVHVVDAEYVDLLATRNAVERAAWAPLIRPDLRHRLDGGRLSTDLVWTDRSITQLMHTSAHGVDTDLGHAASIARLVFTGSVNAKVRADLPQPLVALLDRMSDTDAAARHRHLSIGHELTTGHRTAEAVVALTPRPDEPALSFGLRLDPALAALGPVVFRDAWQWASHPSSPAALRMLGVRWLANADASPDLPGPTGQAAAIFHLTSASLPEDDDLLDALDRANVSEATIAQLASALDRRLHAPTVERIQRLWPELVAGPDATPVPHPSGDGPQAYLSDGWLHALATSARQHGPSAPAPDGRFALVVDDDPLVSFTVHVSDGRIVGLVRGAQPDATTTTHVDSLTLADHLDGTARPYRRPGRSSSWRALACAIAALPGPDAIREATSSESWPRRHHSPTPHPPFTDAWLDELVLAARHLPSSGARPGPTAFTIVDDPTQSFRLIVGFDGRISDWDRSDPADDRRRPWRGRHRDLVAVLLSAPETLPGRSGLSLPDVAPLMAPQGPEPFWTKSWARAWSVAADDRPPDASERWTIVSDGGTSMIVETSPRGPLIRSGRAPGTAYRIAGPRLWDVLVEGHPWPTDVVPPPIAALLHTRPPSAQFLSIPNPALRVPPGERARTAQAAARHQAAERRRRIVGGAATALHIDRRRAASDLGPKPAERAELLALLLGDDLAQRADALLDSTRQDL